MSTRDIKFQKQNRRIPYISRLLRFWYCLYTQVIPALEIVPTGFRIEVVALVAYRIHGSDGLCKGAGDGEHGSPCVVGICRNHFAGSVVQIPYHAEAVPAVIVISTVVTESGSLAVVVQELQRISVTYFRDQISFVPDILNSAVADRLTGSQPIGVILKRKLRAIGQRHSRQPSAVPCEGRGISPVKRVAGEVVAYRNPVVLRQQVFPVGIAVGVVHRAERLSEGSCGVGILALCQDVSALVIVSIRYDR